MSHLGCISRTDDRFFAKVDTQESGVRYKMEGPLRREEKEALHDLDYIRSAAEGDVTQAEGLHSMKLAAKELRDEVKAQAQVAKLEAKKAANKDHEKANADGKTAARGGVKANGSECFTARIRYIEKSVEKEIAGPPRRTERRAKADLDKLRKAATGQVTTAAGFVAMRAKCKELHEEADFEARVAMGLARYGFTRDAHKVADSDPESEGEAAAPAHKDDGDDWVYDADFSDPAVVKKMFPPPTPKKFVAPKDMQDATQQLVRFSPNFESPATLRALLAARADPNVNVCKGDPLPLLPELQRALLDARVDPSRFVRKVDMSPLLVVISRARQEHLNEMRDVLIEHGADYGVEERRRYQSRRDSDEYDPIYLREFHRSATSDFSWEHMRCHT